MKRAEFGKEPEEMAEQKQASLGKSAAATA